MFFSVPEVTMRLEDIIEIKPGTGGNEGKTTINVVHSKNRTPKEYLTTMSYNEVVAKLYNTIKLWTNLEER